MLYSHLLSLHSYTRWLVLVSLIWTLYLSIKGYYTLGGFGRTENMARIFMVTITHIQSVIGFVLYFVSPVVKYFLSHPSESWSDLNVSFFGAIHATLMTIAVVVATIGSSLTKRESTPQNKHRTLLRYSLITLSIIMVAVPWPFSPLAQRPWIR